MKIMIVEDDQTIAAMIEESLHKWGLAAVRVEQFNEVLQTFVREKPQLVVMDINLPAYDGFYWCAKIRELSKAPVLFLSSRSTPMDVVMAINTGGDDYIQKPFYSDVLLAKINALLRRAYAYADIASDVLEHDGVVLHIGEGSVRCGGAKAELTRNELKILSLLMRQPGAIVSRDKMMRALWEDESFVDDNTLTVNMTRLRRKLAELGRGDFVATRKGQGYMIQ